MKRETSALVGPRGLDSPRRLYQLPGDLHLSCTANRTGPTAAPTSVASPTDSAPSPRPSASPAPPADPFALLSEEHLLSYIADLTAIQPYSGWRNSATEGEAEALDYAAAQLGEMAYLRELGLELERQTFHVFLGTDLWETRWS